MADRLEFNAGESMAAAVVNLGVGTAVITLNVGKTGDAVPTKYRTGATAVACSEAEWVAYTEPFASLGYVPVMLEVAP